MSKFKISPAGAICAELTLCGDPVISHYALVLAACSNGECRIDGFHRSDNTLMTLKALQALGVQTDTISDSSLFISGRSGKFLSSGEPFDCGSSKRTSHLLMGLLATLECETTVLGDTYLSDYFLSQIIEPLTEMKASMHYDGETGYLPITFSPAELKASKLMLDPQEPGVKPALLIAALRTEGKTTILEKYRSPDHIERLLNYFNAPITSRGQQIDIKPVVRLKKEDEEHQKIQTDFIVTLRENGKILQIQRTENLSTLEPILNKVAPFHTLDMESLEESLPKGQTTTILETNQIDLIGKQPIHARDISIPGDFTLAAYFITAAAIIPGSSLEMKNIGLNPTRTEVLNILMRMGAFIREHVDEESMEPVGTVHLKKSEGLAATTLSESEVLFALDELPAICVAAAFAEGDTFIPILESLRLCEGKLIDGIISALTHLGVEIDESMEGITISGPCRVQGGSVSCHGDHRIALALTVLGLASEGAVEISDATCLFNTYPDFKKTLQSLFASKKARKLKSFGS